MDGKICLYGLEFEDILGTLPEEREEEQKISVDIELIRDVQQPVETDRLEDTIDTFQIHAEVQHVVDNARPELMERLAYLIGKRLLNRLSCSEAQVTVRKPEIFTSSTIPCCALTMTEDDLGDT